MELLIVGKESKGLSTELTSLHKLYSLLPRCGLSLLEDEFIVKNLIFAVCFSKKMKLLVGTLL